MSRKCLFTLTAFLLILSILPSAFAINMSLTRDPDEWDQAIALGIADGAMQARAQELCSEADAVKMIAAVHSLRYGGPSKYLADMLKAAKPAAACRYWLAQAIYCSAMEALYQVPYTGYKDWMDYCDEHDPGYFWPDACVMGVMLSDQTIGEGGVWDLCPDLSDIEDPADKSLVYQENFGYSDAVNYVMQLFDRTDGAKVLELDEQGRFLPQKTLSFDTAVQAIMRYYRSFEETPRMVSYGDVAGYDPSIITNELLQKESALPDASCQNLPSQWHGVLMNDMGFVSAGALGARDDKLIYEGDIQMLKDAGFNFVGLGFDFSMLQGPDRTEGKINESRLKVLDQVIAWCIARDIHVDLRCCGVGGSDYFVEQEDWFAHNHKIVNSKNKKDYAEFASLWAALARRYQNISNKYLSFNLMIEPEIYSEKQYAAFFTPAITAIREVTPERCIIADISSSGLTGVSMAKLGVALSFHLYEPAAFCMPADQKDDLGFTQAYLSSVVWPYKSAKGKVYDAEKAMDVRATKSVSANLLLTTASKYNVGFMIGEFGIFGEPPGRILRWRYSDDTFYGYLKDMTSLFASKGIAWCYGVCQGNTGIAADYPAVETEVYKKVEGSTVYAATKVIGWFKEFNGVK